VLLLPRSRSLVLLVAGLGLLAGGCGNDQDPVVGAGDATTTTASDDATTTTAAGASGLAVTTVSTPPAARGLLKSVKATAAGGVDRVTFEFEGDLPGYRVGYVERPLVEDGSGEEVPVDGAAVLGIHFEPASGFDLSGEGRQVYEGPERLDLATRVVLDAVRVSDFEANLDWALGVDAKAPFRVRTETSPNRLIVEVAVAAAG
jgi:hypothetical protein